MLKNVLLFGTGYMGEEYLKVLKSLKCNVSLIGREVMKTKKVAKKYGAYGFGQGIDALNKINASHMDLAIIASSIDSLFEVTLACLQSGIKNILIEKPGALYLKDLQKIRAAGKKANVRIAYNRRFYNSVLGLKKRISQDSGAVGCFFDFTDREKDIKLATQTPSVVAKWGWANSSHVIDAAFYLIGIPKKIFSARKGSWPFHKSGNVFVGHGNTEACPFSYFSTWAGGGRWNIEVSTQEGRYRLSPLEELQFCRKNQFAWDKIQSSDNDDNNFKPGLYKMVKSALDGNCKGLPDLDEQMSFGRTINKIFGYEN